MPLTAPEFSIVITAFRRPDKLERCVLSALVSGAPEVVVTVSGHDPGVEAVLAQFGDRIRVTRTVGDPGNNEAWLRGVYAARGQFVVLLHDDDFLTPEFGASAQRHIIPALRQGLCGFASWRASVIGRGLGENLWVEGPTRVSPSEALRGILMGPQRLSPSPALSMFRRDDLIHWLKEAGQALSQIKACVVRNNFLVGNDLLIYLRAMEKYESFFLCSSALVVLDSHEGSETVRRFSDGTLQRAYEAVRDYARRVRPGAFLPAPKILRVWSDYSAQDSDAARNARARGTWAAQEETGEVFQVPVLSGDLARDSKTELDDPRALPFLRDVVEFGMLSARPEDIVCLTNADTAIVEDGTSIILDKMRELEAMYFWRANFRGVVDKARMKVSSGIWDGGVDMLAFSPGWWLSFRSGIPDFVLGCLGWDTVLRVIIAETHPGRGAGVYGAITHEIHPPSWKKEGGQYVNQAQCFNGGLTRSFFMRRVGNLE